MPLIALNVIEVCSQFNHHNFFVCFIYLITVPFLLTGRIIYLEYKPPNPAKKTIMLVGKGVTYDTGGADIKAGGIMAGMSRDKCGAAAVAGYMKVIAEMKPADVHVYAAMCMVRNSVGEESYVADEIITSRAGLRVRVGNTDAEGRMCMADALCKVNKQLLIQERERDLTNVFIFSLRKWL